LKFWFSTSPDVGRRSDGRFALKADDGPATLVTPLADSLP
jgi:hypothetical protein